MSVPGWTTVRALVCSTCLGATFFVGACKQPDGWQGLHSTNPVDRSETIVKIAKARDYHAIPALIDRLEDNDRAVRMYASVALRELVGQDFGYRFYDEPAERATAVTAWRQALREGRLRPATDQVGAQGGMSPDGQSDPNRPPQDPPAAESPPSREELSP